MRIRSDLVLEGQTHPLAIVEGKWFPVKCEDSAGL